MKFYNNKENDSLKFKLNAEGINVNTIEARLIFESEDKNYIFFGKINEDMCIFNIPKLELYEKGKEGNIRFEIITEDLYFNIWKDRFIVDSKATITFEQVSNVSTQETNKPKISASAILEEKEDTKPEIIEKKNTINKEKPVSEKKEDTKPEIIEKKNTINKEKPVSKIKENESNTTKPGDMMDFQTFIRTYKD